MPFYSNTNTVICRLSGINSLSLMIGNDAVKLIQESSLTIPELEKLKNKDESLEYPNYHKLINRNDIEILNQDIVTRIVLLFPVIEHLKLAVNQLNLCVINPIRLLLQQYRESLQTLELYFRFPVYGKKRKRLPTIQEEEPESDKSWIELLFDQIQELTDLREFTLDIQSVPFPVDFRNDFLKVNIKKEFVQNLTKFNINIHDLKQDDLLERLNDSLLAVSKSQHKAEDGFILNVHRKAYRNNRVDIDIFIKKLIKLKLKPENEIQIGNLVVQDPANFWFSIKEPQFSDKLLINLSIKEEISYKDDTEKLMKKSTQLRYVKQFTFLQVLRLEHVSNIPLYEIVRHLESLPDLFHLELGYHVNAPFNLSDFEVSEEKIKEKISKRMLELKSLKILTLCLDLATFHHLENYPLSKLFPNLQIIRIHLKLDACPKCNPEQSCTGDSIRYNRSCFSKLKFKIDDFQRLLFTHWQEECSDTLRHAYLLGAPFTKQEELIHKWEGLRTEANGGVIKIDG